MFKSVKTTKSNVDANEACFLITSARWVMKAAIVCASLEFPYPLTSYSRPNRVIFTASVESPVPVFNSIVLLDSRSFR